MTRHLFLLVCIAASGVFPAANAATVRLFEKSVPKEISVTGTHYEVDEKLGRARLIVELLDESFEGRLFEETVEVPGLSFDRKSGEVRYRTRESEATCAVRKKVLWATTYEPTPACRVGVRNEARLKDEGHGAARLTAAVVEMTVDDAIRSSGR